VALEAKSYTLRLRSSRSDASFAYNYAVDGGTGAASVLRFSFDLRQQIWYVDRDAAAKDYASL
jgi:hypothetical protein